MILIPLSHTDTGSILSRNLILQTLGESPNDLRWPYFRLFQLLPTNTEKVRIGGIYNTQGAGSWYTVQTTEYKEI